MNRMDQIRITYCIPLSAPSLILLTYSFKNTIYFYILLKHSNILILYHMYLGNVFVLIYTINFNCKLFDLFHFGTHIAIIDLNAIQIRKKCIVSVCLSFSHTHIGREAKQLLSYKQSQSSNVQYSLSQPHYKNDPTFIWSLVSDLMVYVGDIPNNKNQFLPIMKFQSNLGGILVPYLLVCLNDRVLEMVKCPGSREQRMAYCLWENSGKE